MRSKILSDADRLIHGQRQEDYGDPETSLNRIANLWGSYLEEDITATDVALMMALLKIARAKHSFDVDSLVDAAGYIALSGKFVEPEPPQEEHRTVGAPGTTPVRPPPMSTTVQGDPPTPPQVPVADLLKPWEPRQ